ncbi:MAG: TIGR04086 family membrane protein [Tannerellaceae bacterium]|nr:TIGR04086 family membrane protein [Tannerellaceae bacterium]MCD8264628.1 TIGR04086 family membrane protein [Tannerellaceae bacterium]
MREVNRINEVNVVGNRCRRVSWGAIIGGLVTVLAVSFLLSLIGTSIGLFMYDPLGKHAFGGVGTSVGIWTVISLLASLAAGGFVAGKLAARDGMIHGFLTWASSLIVAVILGAMLISSTTKIAANLLGSVSSVTGDILSGVGSVVSEGASDVASLFDNIDLDTDGDEIRQDVNQTLRKTGIKEFQPNYIKGQLSAVESDLKRSVKQLAANPQQAESIIDGFTQRLQTRADNYASNIDREKVVTAITNSTNLSRAEAEDTVDQYMELLQQGRNKLEDLQTSIQEARQEWEEKKEEALKKSEEVANSAAWTAIWSFLALLLGAAIATFAGRFGAIRTREGYEV